MKITPNQFAWIFLCVLLTLIGWGAYKMYLFLQNPADHILSVENEMKLGEMIVEQSYTESNGFSVVHKSYADSCINVIQNRLIAALVETAYRYDFKIVDREEVNAFAIPGGKIFIHSGLIRFAHSPEELAAVLAHEMGHVEKRHTVNRMINQFGMDAVLEFITDGTVGSTRQISGQMMSLYFSREDESEADVFAIDLLQKAGINPKAMSEVFSGMKAEGGDMTGVLNMLSTHPELESRAKLAATPPLHPNFMEMPFHMDWARVQAEMIGN